MACLPTSFFLSSCQIQGSLSLNYLFSLDPVGESQKNASHDLIQTLFLLLIFSRAEPFLTVGS